MFVRNMMSSLVAVMAMGFVLFAQKPEEITAQQRDLDRMAQESYQGVFLSMYPVDGYSEGDFAYYRGVDTVIADYVIPEISAFAEYFDQVFETDNEVTNVYLGVDPVEIWSVSEDSVYRWKQEMRSFLSYLQGKPQITFEIMLPYPEMDYWTNMSPDQLESAMEAYRVLLRELDKYANVAVYYLGAEQWLIANPANYDGEMKLNAELTKKVMLYTFCDGQYRIGAWNREKLLQQLETLVANELEKPAVYPDFSEWKLVFFGDSVIGNYAGSYSVPGVVSGLSGADTYNFALGGTLATDTAGSNKSFLDLLNEFMEQTIGTTRDEIEFPFEAFGVEDEKLCFLIHYGLNDYFDGEAVENHENALDTETYAGALRVGVRKLREAYPNAKIILMTPPYCIAFQNGTATNGKDGGTLIDYVAAVENVATEENVICMNNYTGLGINAENAHLYLPDHVHLNEQGRFMLGCQIVEILQQNIR